MHTSQRPLRVCADCGYKDSSPIPPAMCPKCHNNEGSPLAPINALQQMNRKTRRRHEKQQRLLQERTQKQLDRERKDGPIKAE